MLSEKNKNCLEGITSNFKRGKVNWIPVLENFQLLDAMLYKKSNNFEEKSIQMTEKEQERSLI